MEAIEFPPLPGVVEPVVFDTALLVLRVTFGMFFALHGLNKVGQLVVCSRPGSRS